MAAVDKFAEDVLQKYGCIDVLVNNAAILGPISYDGDATKNPNMGQGPIDGEARHAFQVKVAEFWSVGCMLHHGLNSCEYALSPGYMHLLTIYADG